MPCDDDGWRNRIYYVARNAYQSSAVTQKKGDGAYEMNTIVGNNSSTNAQPTNWPRSILLVALVQFPLLWFLVSNKYHHGCCIVV